MYLTSIFPGRYIQGAGVLDTLEAELNAICRRPLLLMGGTASRSDDLVNRINSWRHIYPTCVQFGGECSDEEVLRILGVLPKGIDCVVGIGGGKVLDTAKLVADRLEIECAVVPTIASTDAPVSALSVIYRPNGEFERYEFLKRNPRLVLVDSKVIADAPSRYLAAGIADAAATYYEAQACNASGATNFCGGFRTESALVLARRCLEIVKADGLLAASACREHLVTPELERIIEANTLMSGVGFESCGLAAAHSLHNAFTRFAETHSFLHGEKVAVGVLVGLIISQSDRKEINEMMTLFDALGLPICTADLGIDCAIDGKLHVIATLVCSEQETMRNEPSKVTPSVVEDALMTNMRYAREFRGEKF